MALEILGALPAGFFSIQNVVLIGDGASSQIVIDLTQAPFALNFAGNNPNTLRNFIVVPSISGVTATATLIKANLRVVLSAPLPNDETMVIAEASWSFK